MTNPTAQKFGCPHSLVAEAASGLVLAYPGQPTLGAPVVVRKEQAEAFSQLSPAVDLEPPVAEALVKRLRALRPAA